VVKTAYSWGQSLGQARQPELYERIHVIEAFAKGCPMCKQPTFFNLVGGQEAQVPGSLPGATVEHLPEAVDRLYAEARSAMAAGAPTVAVLGFRKLLMHVAVEKGAEPGLSFQKYVTYLDVTYLDENPHLPVGAKEWVDHIRKRSNEANHEIVMMKPDDAQELLVFSDMLLRLVYEFPKRLPKRETKQ
jgi:hypothetical protein